MKLRIKQKKITEQEDELKNHRFNKEELSSRVEELDQNMHRIAMPLQEKVPLQVANEYFLKYISGDRVSARDVNKSIKIGDFADEQGLVRIADIFILAEIYNNLDLSWMLNKHKG